MYPMQNRDSKIRHAIFQVAVIAVVVFILIACEPVIATSVAKTEEAVDTATILETPLVDTLEPTQIAPSTPPALPSPYQSNTLNPLDTPRTYLQDTCHYLRSRWHPANAQPGTVVMIIMLHGIYRGPVEELGGITLLELKRMMDRIHDQNFEAITTEKFLAFMERNVKIPPRSVLIIQDDRHQAENFDKNFRDYWDNWGWPIVNGWPSQPDTPESLWQENIALEKEGWVDHQAQGVMIGTYLTDDSSKAVITRELEGSIEAFAERYAKVPLAFIWPGGGFGLRTVEAARQLGYQLGFTWNSRGPVMYNWVPLADDFDPERPSYIPEGQIGDPLMTLPRYWPNQVAGALDQVRIMGREAGEYAQTNKAIELKYYEIVCEPSLGPMP